MFFLDSNYYKNITSKDENEILLDNTLFEPFPSLDFDNKINIFSEDDILAEKRTYYITCPTNSSKSSIYKIEDIQTIFENNINSYSFGEILKNFKKDIDIERAELKFLGNKRNKKDIPNKNNERIQVRKGRKKKDDDDCTQRNHNKKSPDNIIKKIKSMLFGSMVEFINNILKSCNISAKILKIDYKYINQIKRENDLKFLNSSIKDILSLDISSKYSFEFDSNKKTIESLLKENKDNRLLIFALNLKFNEWLDFFTLKKDIEKLDEIFSKELGKNMTKIDVILNKIFKKNESNNYISSFIFYLYNYESWFINKRIMKKGEYPLEDWTQKK
jgi:hypothetical protein